MILQDVITLNYWRVRAGRWWSPARQQPSAGATDGQTGQERMLFHYLVHPCMVD